MSDRGAVEIVSHADRSIASGKRVQVHIEGMPSPFVVSQISMSGTSSLSFVGARAGTEYMIQADRLVGILVSEERARRDDDDD